MYKLKFPIPVPLDHVELVGRQNLHADLRLDFGLITR